FVAFEAVGAGIVGMLLPGLALASVHPVPHALRPVVPVIARHLRAGGRYAAGRQCQPDQHRPGPPPPRTILRHRFLPICSCPSNTPASDLAPGLAVTARYAAAGWRGR